MSSTETARRERPRLAIAAFLLLVFPLSWYPWVIALLQHRTSGPNPLGVLVAGLIASAIWRGWRGLRDLLVGLVKVIAPLRCWAVALLTPVAIVAASVAVARILGAPVQWKAPTTDLVDRFVFTFLFVALGEEPGWRGFLQPALQRLAHPIAAVLLVALVWAPWHLPLLGTEFSWPIVPAFLASLLGGAIPLAWLYNASRGSVLLPMITHALLNTVGAGYAFHFVSAGDQQHLWTIYAALWLAAGLVVIVLTRGRLGTAKPVT